MEVARDYPSRKPPHSSHETQGEDLSGFPAFKSEHRLQKQIRLEGNLNGRDVLTEFSWPQYGTMSKIGMDM